MKRLLVHDGTRPSTSLYSILLLTHWGRVMHIGAGKLTTIASDNGSSPGRRQAIIWTNAGILLIGPLGTNVNEIVIEIQTFSFEKKYLEVSSAKWRPFCLGLNVLNGSSVDPSAQLIYYTRDDCDMLGWRPANERRYYKITPSLIGWTET